MKKRRNIDLNLSNNTLEPKISLSISFRNPSFLQIPPLVDPQPPLINEPLIPPGNLFPPLEPVDPPPPDEIHIETGPLEPLPPN